MNDQAAPSPTHRPVALWLTGKDGPAIREALETAGFGTIQLSSPQALADALGPGETSLLALIEVGADAAPVVAAVAEARRGHTGGLGVLYLADPEHLDALVAAGVDDGDELVLPPWTGDSIRWRLEAMAVRAQVPTTLTRPDAVLAHGHIDADWAPSASIFAVFNPKGGVGKTTIATNLAAMLQLRKGREVLLVDADTVTGHVALSLGLTIPRSFSDSWIDEDAGYAHESVIELAVRHSSGILVAALTSDPLTQPTLNPERVAEAIVEARRYVDAVVVDLHPSYSEVNLAIFSIADRIIVPVTPDLPAMRAAIQLKEVAAQIGVSDRLALVVNRANSGVGVSDIEETIGLHTVAQIRSAGLHFVWSANAGKTLIDKFPKHPVAQDFDHLADRLLAVQGFAAPASPHRDVLTTLRGLFSRRAASEA